MACFMKSVTALKADGRKKPVLTFSSRHQNTESYSVILLPGGKYGGRMGEGVH